MAIATWAVIGLTCGVLTNRARSAQTDVFADILVAIGGAVIGGITATSVGLVRPPGLHVGAVLAALATALVALFSEHALSRFLHRRRG